MIRIATRDRQVAVEAIQPPGARSRDVGLAGTVAVLQFAGVAIFWFVIIPHGLAGAWAADLRGAGVPPLIASKIFGLYHVPLNVAGGNSVGLSLAIGLFGLLPGLLLGYLFYRTRSIWPGAIWHTSFSGVGLLFW